MSITFQNQNIKFSLKEKLKIKYWILNVIKLEKKKIGELNFIFTNDDELLKKNIQFLKHNFYTDILTFNSSDNLKISGDIIISIERINENFKRYNSSFDIELKRVIIHGVFHLLGYNDKKKDEINEMRNKENWALNLF